MLISFKKLWFQNVTNSMYTIRVSTLVGPVGRYGFDFWSPAKGENFILPATRPSSGVLAALRPKSKEVPLGDAKKN